jgi:phenylacetate-CoA ligase
MFLGEAMRESEWPREEFKLRIGAFGAEPWTEDMRVKLEASLGIKAYDIYGLSEIAGPGVGFECECQNGTHLNEDYFFPEIVNPETGEPMAEGEFGELCFTHLTKEGMPLLRYRTHDLTALHYDRCSCGRTLVRMDRILGRCDDMLIIRGVNVFPSQIETVLLSLGYAANYQIIVGRVNNTDTLDVHVEMTPEMFTDNLGEIGKRQKDLVDGLKSMLGLKAKVTLVAPKSITRSEGKAVRVIDNRKI